MQDSSGMTHAEFYRLHGTLTPGRIEEALAVIDGAPDVSGACTYIEEGMTGLVAEDFMAEPIDQIRKLVNNLRGANKTEGQRILGMLEDFAQVQFNQADYGRSELRKALKDLGHTRNEPTKDKPQ